MELIIEGMNGCMRCPSCHLLPLIHVDHKTGIWLQCERHGHIANGITLEQAVKHWNHYVSFLFSKVA